MGGSSPHARGTLPADPLPRNPCRFIPARAGNTLQFLALVDPPLVHPRTRGEHHAQRIRYADEIRFIPARAGNTAKMALRLAKKTVHPRTRGEHGNKLHCCCSFIGSSPHARGTRDNHHVRFDVFRFIPARAGNTEELTFLRYNTRFIPARAGNTPRFGNMASCTPVHPRTRGEHSIFKRRSFFVAGSSPHARGTPARTGGFFIRLRFIPARAGNTITAIASSVLSPVHPRTRGEHIYCNALCLCLHGSSPHARGTLLVFRLHRFQSRFIPARAGNTSYTSASTRIDSVHPRTRGEHFWLRLEDAEKAGSSPHARGTPRSSAASAWSARFIPARAGNTSPKNKKPYIRAVHPRTRGEHEWSNDYLCPNAGSSPHARGTPPPSTSNRNFPRFIPARAGNTSGCLPAMSKISVHPRTRGEHSVRECVRQAISGSSPHARGTRRSS